MGTKESREKQSWHLEKENSKNEGKRKTRVTKQRGKDRSSGLARPRRTHESPSGQPTAGKKGDKGVLLFSILCSG